MGRAELESTLIDDFRSHFAFPQRMAIETSNTCNLRCRMCPIYGGYNLEPETAPRMNVKERVFMDFDLYERLLREAAAHGTTNLQLQFYDEPLLHPRLLEMLKKAHELGFTFIHMNTNGTLLTPKLCDQLLETGVDSMTVSIDAATSQVYQELRGNPRFEQVCQTIEYLAGKIREGSHKFSLSVSLVQVPENQSETSEFISRWINTVEYVRIDKPVDSLNRARDAFFHPSQRVICFYPWQVICVLADGAVVKCCGDFNLKDVVGNVKENTLEEIWQGDRYMDYRRNLLQGRIDLVPLCDQCDLWMQQLVKEGTLTENSWSYSESPLERIYRPRVQADVPVSEGLIRRVGKRIELLFSKNAKAPIGITDRK